MIGRLSVTATDDSVDALMADSSSNSGSYVVIALQLLFSKTPHTNGFYVIYDSKLRSDDILAKDTRATVLVAPPGADPKEYTQKAQGGRGRGGRGGRRGGRGRGRRGGDNG